MLWSGELVGVRSRTVAVVDYLKLLFTRAFFKQQSVHSCGRCDSARLILPSGNQAHFLFRIRYHLV